MERPTYGENLGSSVLSHILCCCYIYSLLLLSHSHLMPHLSPTVVAATETIVTFALLALIIGGGVFNVAAGKVALPF